MDCIRGEDLTAEAGKKSAARTLMPAAAFAMQENSPDDALPAVWRLTG